MNQNLSVLQETLVSLKQQRDELALKIHLGGMEAKEEWDKVQEKISDLSQKMGPLREAVSESSSEVIASLGLVADEVKKSFERIRKLLQG